MAAITTALVVAGLAVGAAGAYESYQGSKGQAGAQQQEIQLEQQAEAQRKVAMETNARRLSLENTRNMIRARSLALSNSVNQGANQGSGLQGGYGQISGQGLFNQQGINDSLETGENLFKINSQISQAKIAYSQAGSQVATGNALSSLGKSVVGAAGTASNLFAGFGGDVNGDQFKQTGSAHAYGSGGYYGQGPFIP